MGIISQYAEEGLYPILVETVENGFYGDDVENVKCKITNGGITIIYHLPVDINSDWLVCTKDITVLRRYIADGYGIELN